MIYSWILLGFICLMARPIHVDSMGSFGPPPMGYGAPYMGGYFPPPYAMNPYAFGGYPMMHYAPPPQLPPPPPPQPIYTTNDHNAPMTLTQAPYQPITILQSQFDSVVMNRSNTPVSVTVRPR